MPESNTHSPSSAHSSDTFGSGAESRMDSVVNAAKETAHDLSSQASRYADKAKDRVKDWVGAASGSVEDAKERASELASTAMHKAEDWSKDVANLIRKYPIPALGLAFGVGLIIAQLAREIAPPIRRRL